MSEVSFTFFETAVGRCGIAWGGRGAVSVLLPEKSEAASRSRLARRFPDAREAVPPPEIQRAIDDIVALLAGERRDLSDVPLDFESLPAFHRRVYEVARAIPPGSTISYGEIAARLGEPRAAREVGEALSKNPFPIVVPCHRVLAAGQAWRLLRARRRRDEAAAPRDRGSAQARGADAVRGSSPRGPVEAAPRRAARSSAPSPARAARSSRPPDTPPANALCRRPGRPRKASGSRRSR